MEENLRDMIVSINFDTDTSPVNDMTKAMREFSSSTDSTAREIVKSAKVVDMAYKGMIDESKAFVNQFSRQSDVIRKLARDSGMSATHLSEAWADMSTDMRKSLIQNHNQMRKFRKDLLDSEFDMRKLGMQMGHYSGNTNDFMKEVQKLGKEHKKITDQMINSNISMRQGIIEGIATMSAMSTQSEKIAKGYARMNNALLSVNKPFLNISSSLAKIARDSNAAQIALKMLGPNAKMKDLQDTIGVINQGIMRQQSLLFVAGTAWLGFTAIMAHAALGPDPSRVKQQEANLTKVYRDAWSQRVSEVSNFVGLFEKASIPKVKTSDLTKALQSQVNAIKTWQSNLQGLVKKGVDNGLIKELQKAGPSAAGQIKALNSMSKPELDKYVSLWHEKMSLARTQATDELSKLKQETDQKIKDLQNSLTPLGKAWEKFKSTWVTALKPFVEAWGQIAATFVNIGTEVGKFVQKLNEINPSIIKVVGMFAYLTSTLVLLLTPLAIGIGYIWGIRAALGAAWKLIGPFVEGLGAMMGTVLLLATGIIAVSAALRDMYKNSETFRNIVGSALTAVSNLFSPIINGAQKVLTTIAHWDMLSPIVLGLAAALATLKSVSLATVAITKLRSAILLLSNPMARAILLTKVWTGVQKAFNLSVKANPYVLLASALVGLVVALTLAYDRSEKFRQVVNKAFTVARNVVGTSIDFIKNVSKTMWNNALSSTEAFRAAFGAKVSTFGSIIVKGFKASTATVGSFFTDMGSDVAKFFSIGLGNKAKTIATGFVKDLQNGFGHIGLGDAAKTITNGFVQQLKVGFSSVGGVVSLVAPLITGIALSLAGVSGPIGIAIGAIVSLVGTLYRLSKTNADVRKALSSAWTGIKTVITSVLTALSPIFKVFEDSFSQMAKELGPQFQQTGKVIAQSIVQLKPSFVQLGQAFGELFSAIAQIIPTLLPLFMQLFQGWSQISVTLVSSILQIAVSVLPIFVQAFQQLVPMVLSIIKAVFPIVVQLIASIIPVVLRIVQTLFPMLLQVVTAVFPVILQIINSVIPVVAQIFIALAPVISQIAISIIPLILQAVQLVFPVVLQIIQMVMPIVVTLLKLAATIITTLVIPAIRLILQVVQLVFPLVLQIIQMAIPIIAAVLRVAVSVITGVLIPAIRFILKIVQLVFPAVISVIRSAINIVTNIVKLFSAILRGDWSGAWHAILNILKSVWSIIKTVISTGIKIAVTFIKSGWNAAKSHTASMFSSIKSHVANTFRDIVDGAKALPGKIGNGIKSMAGKALSGVKHLANTLIGGLAKGVNGVSGGINWVLKEIGVKKRIPDWNPPKYATGTSFHPGGPAIVGDGPGAEFIRTPAGQIGLSPARSTLVNLPRGTEVLPHKETRRLLNSGFFPAYASGKGNGLLHQASDWIKNKASKVLTGAKNLGLDAWNGTKHAASNVASKVKSVASKAKSVALDVWSYIENPGALMKKLYAKYIPKLPSMNGAFGTVLSGSMKLVKNKAVGFVKDKLKDFGGNWSGGTASSAQVKKWISAAIQATGVSKSWLGALTSLAMHESGGNPKAINLWDSNAKAGHPSKGLMQTIDSTFNAYKLPGMNDIYNPIHNAVAAIRYMVARYKSIGNVPGIKNMSSGKGYVGYATGGIAKKPQWATLAENGWKEFIIPTQPSMRKNALSLLAQANAELGYDSNQSNSSVNSTYNPTTSTTSGGKSVVINYDPHVEINVDGNVDDGTKQSLKKEFQDMLDDHYKKLLALFNPTEVV
ncbi:transglycosylase SLT domain-containing protein [Heyndrickxia ginsengihumi]|uniref:transglycosylase SLT domain-containing protein n=1 Tax=Heyndrickxia ginsengihumi TaxID=363870 RepID=UPI00046FADC3|nr:transglycosylase SLT domain-containing protein [Heyndrickxia ginsengihumi]